MLDRLLAFVAPHSCCGCGNLGTLLCDNCRNDIISEPFPQCLICLKPTIDTNICSQCQRSGNIDAAWVVSTRDDALKTLIDRYKFRSAIQAASICGQLLDLRLPLLAPQVTIVPVPTAPGHVRVRGFDHTASIAREFSRLRSLRYQQVLQRYGASTQHLKTRSERLSSASSGLSIKHPAPTSVLLIDDIYTTGATIHACAAVLRSAGVKNLYVAIIARQTLDDIRDL